LPWFVGGTLKGELAVGDGCFGDVVARIVHQRHGSFESRYVTRNGVAVLLSAAAQHNRYGCNQ